MKTFWRCVLTVAHNQACGRGCSRGCASRRDGMQASAAAQAGRRRVDERRLRATLGPRTLSTFDDVRCFYNFLRLRRARCLDAFVSWSEVFSRVEGGALMLTDNGTACSYCCIPIYGAHVVWMQYSPCFALDLCHKPVCVGCTVKTRALIVQHRRIGKVLWNATAGLGHAKALSEKDRRIGRQRGLWGVMGGP